VDLLLLPVSEEDCKTFCLMSRIRPVTARPAPHC